MSQARLAARRGKREARPSTPPLVKALFSLFLVLATVRAALAVTVDFVPVGDAGNPADGTGFGAVAYNYAIGEYDVTNAQYAEFLNAKAASDPNALYNPKMSSGALGGIVQSGVSGSFTYAVKLGQGQQPVIYVSFLDCMRFANWLNNGQGAASTETGAYTLSLGGLAPRNAAANIWVPSENEWYKAAYYQPAAHGGDADGYWLYPTRSNTPPNSRNGSTTDPNSANLFYDDGIANGYNGGYAVTNAGFSSGQDYLTNVGAFTVAGSYYGTYDQGGNVYQWNDTIIGTSRGLRGGAWAGGEGSLRATFSSSNAPTYEDIALGFRVATVPEAGSGLLVGLGLASGLALRRLGRGSTRVAR